MTTLADAHVVVTGGAEGIGLETARLLLARGARVSLVSRSPDKLAAAQASLGGDLAQQHTALLRRQMELNYFGAVHAVRAVLPGMLAAGRGHVVLFSSAAGLTGVFGYAGYSPAKAALRAFAEVLEAEHADDGLRVSVAYPPDTLTPGFARENATKPAETAAVSAMVKPISAQRMAQALVDGIEKDRRTITADRGTALLAGGNVLLPAVRADTRRVVRRARP